MAGRHLILHGLAGSGPGHWQHWLAQRLADRGADVHFPDLPDPDLPQLQPWLDALRALDPGHDDVVLCHSLACTLWLHHRASGGATAARVLLVAPPGEGAGVPEIEPFFPVPRDPSLAVGCRLVCSDDDPYCPAGAVREYGVPLRVAVDLLPGAGHINADSGYGAWPSVERWAVGETDRIELNPYGAKNGIDT